MMRTLVVAAAVGAVSMAVCESDEVRHPRLATWNIRDYPDSDQQEEAVFALLPRLGVDVVALQEITAPQRFRDEARARLGGQWRAEFADERTAVAEPGRRTFGTEPPDGGGAEGPTLQRRVGLLFNDDRYDLGFVREHQEIVLYEGARPALEVGLWWDDDADDDAPPRLLDVIVVHLKAGYAHGAMRRRQLTALAPIVARARARVAGKGAVVVLGDFNAAGADDRAALADFAADSGVVWASADVGCTARFPDRAGAGRCVGAAFDHVFVGAAGAAVDVTGPCADACNSDTACPAFPSDHCPVVVALTAVADDAGLGGSRCDRQP